MNAITAQKGLLQNKVDSTEEAFKNLKTEIKELREAYTTTNKSVESLLKEFKITQINSQKESVNPIDNAAKTTIQIIYD